MPICIETLSTSPPLLWKLLILGPVTHREFLLPSFIREKQQGKVEEFHIEGISISWNLFHAASLGRGLWLMQLGCHKMAGCVRELWAPHAV